VDGVDGVAGSVSLVGFFAIFLLSLRPEVNQPPVAILAVIATGVTAGFLFFNMPPARFIAGTSGAYFWGLLLGTLSIFAGTKIATTTLVLAVPILDALWVMIERWRHGVSVFQGDTRYHLHYRLREYGWSDRSIVVAYSLVALSIGLVAPFLSSTGKGWLLCGLGIVLIGFLSLFHRKTSACI
jgi:UDP-GlcNAc:undecaprenyl-phosphate GlcNAc-1-phosphate transferase